MKTRVRNRVTEVKDAATVQVQSARQHLVGVDGKPRPAALGVGGGVLAAIAAVVLVRAVAAALQAPEQAPEPAAFALMSGKRARKDADDEDAADDSASRASNVMRPVMRLRTSRTRPAT